MTRPTSSPLRIAIVGGGFTGAVLAIHAVRASSVQLDLVILEPRAELGRGVAYSTRDRSHRINVPSDRLDIAAETPGAVTAWLHANGFLPDAASQDEAGGAYVPRAAYGAYIADVLAETLAAAAERVHLRHLRTKAASVAAAEDAWRVVTESGETIMADRVALCFGHAVPALPCRLGPGVAESAGFVADPWRADALAGIGADASVLVVGTGLTMADVVTSLGAAGHRGPITAVSRRGLLPKAHGLFRMDLDVVGASPPTTALGLLQLVRRQIAEGDPALGWHPVVDSLRTALPDLWGGLPAAEKRRVVRRLLPFWEVHRFRIAPQIAVTLERARAEGRLVVEQAALAGLDRDADGRLEATLRPRHGPITRRRFDAVVLCTGPEREVARNPLVAALLVDGTACLDTVGLGLAVDRRSRVLGPAGRLQPGLYAFGPMTRGSFGEMTGAPDIAQHIERKVAGLLG